MPGFEPGTSCTPSRRATRLRYIPSLAVSSQQSAVKSSVGSLQSRVYFLALPLAMGFFFAAGAGTGGGTSRSSF